MHAALCLLCHRVGKTNNTGAALRGFGLLGLAFTFVARRII